MRFLNTLALLSLVLGSGADAASCVLTAQNITLGTPYLWTDKADYGLSVTPGTVECTLDVQPVTIRVRLDGSPSARPLYEGGAPGGPALLYSLWLDDKNLWGDGTGGSVIFSREFSPGDVQPFSLTASLILPAGQRVPAGLYRGTLNITLDFDP